MRVLNELVHLDSIEQLPQLRASSASNVKDISRNGGIIVVKLAVMLLIRRKTISLTFTQSHWQWLSRYYALILIGMNRLSFDFCQFTFSLCKLRPNSANSITISQLRFLLNYSLLFSPCFFLLTLDY